MTRSIFRLSFIAVAAFALAGCLPPDSSDKIQAQSQEVILKEITSQTGMPNIKNGLERKNLKMIYELRDQEGYVTNAYIVSKNTGTLVFLCTSMGYPISDATGYTNPDKVIRDNGTAFGTMTQAEPNGLYTPASSNANWIMCVDKEKGKPSPVFVQGDIVVSPIKF